jgi:hypothetical protein
VLRPYLLVYIALRQALRFPAGKQARVPHAAGTLKQEYGLGCSFKSKKQALAAVREAVFLYNTMRPHLALTYETPENMHPRVA